MSRHHCCSIWSAIQAPANSPSSHQRGAISVYGRRTRRRAAFGQACAALTAALGEAANVGYGDSVLDVGVGYGDQTAVWIERFGASRVVAVEVSATHVAAARKAQDAGLLPAAVELRQASAANTRQVIASDGQQFDGVGRQFDVVLCLDCAYHFRPSRKNFLLLAASLALKPGGRYAAVDLIMSRADEDLADDPNATAGWLWWRKTLRACLRRAIALAVDIPSTNLHGVKAYEESLEAGGFEAAKFEVLTDRVLLPFARHAAKQREAALGGVDVWPGGVPVGARVAV